MERTILTIAILILLALGLRWASQEKPKSFTLTFSEEVKPEIVYGLPEINFIGDIDTSRTGVISSPPISPFESSHEVRELQLQAKEVTYTIAEDGSVRFVGKDRENPSVRHQMVLDKEGKLMSWGAGTDSGVVEAKVLFNGEPPYEPIWPKPTTAGPQNEK